MTRIDALLQRQKKTQWTDILIVLFAAAMIALYALGTHRTVESRATPAQSPSMETAPALLKVANAADAPAPTPDTAVR